jgi:hypothetical protein
VLTHNTPPEQAPLVLRRCEGAPALLSILRTAPRSPSPRWMTGVRCPGSAACSRLFVPYSS